MPLVVPCHRVVRSDGRIGEYAFGRPIKVQLLALEGLDADAVEADAAAGYRYLGSAVTSAYCYPTCRHARRIADGRRVAFAGAAAAEAAGFRACAACRPGR